MTSAETPTIKEDGPWEAGVQFIPERRAFVASADFTHDVQLEVNGDFATLGDAHAYAKEIARRLNVWPAAVALHDALALFTNNFGHAGIRPNADSNDPAEEMLAKGLAALEQFHAALIPSP